MRKYFKAVTEKEANGWVLGFTSGNSNEDNQDWIVDTNSLHADQVPDACNDAKSFSMLVAGLLNLYYNDQEIKGRTEEQVMKFGEFNEETEGIPSPKNPTLF